MGGEGAGGGAGWAGEGSGTNGTMGSGGAFRSLRWRDGGRLKSNKEVRELEGSWSQSETRSIEGDGRSGGNDEGSTRQ